MTEKIPEPTPSTAMSQAEGLIAGFHAQLNEVKKRLCCQPTLEQQEAAAQVAVRSLPESLEALEASVNRIPGPSV